MAESSAIAALQSRFSEVSTSEFRGDTRVVVARDDLTAALAILRDEYGYDQLVDLTCVDYLAYRGATDRFGLVYQLANTSTGERLTLRAFLNEPDLLVPSVVPLWPAADWLEREVWDLFGITFDGHPDHRRIVLPDEFAAHPLRKDYPVQGRGERHNFDRLARGDA